jgi:hypothetical protein
VEFRGSEIICIGINYQGIDLNTTAETERVKRG